MNKIRPAILGEIEKLINSFDLIGEGRQKELIEVGEYLAKRVNEGMTTKLIFICTHNSRRSHIAQIWATTAAAYYDISNVEFYSGGTEETAFNAKAVETMCRFGFEIQKEDNSENPVYSVFYSDDEANYKIECFSKRYDSDYNPQEKYTAIMTCSHADENCPVVYGAEKRFSLHYIDPKEYEETEQEKVKYDEICGQMGKEIFFLFSAAKNKLFSS